MTTIREDMIAFITAHVDVVDGPDWDRIIRDDISVRVANIWIRSELAHDALEDDGPLTDHKMLMEFVTDNALHTDYLIDASEKDRQLLISLITEEDCKP